MKDRYSSVTLQGRTFATVIDGDDKHDWELANPAEQAEFDLAWERMADDLRGERRKGVAA